MNSLYSTSSIAFSDNADLDTYFCMWPYENRTVFEWDKVRRGWGRKLGSKQLICGTTRHVLTHFSWILHSESYSTPQILKFKYLTRLEQVEKADRVPIIVRIDHVLTRPFWPFTPWRHTWQKRNWLGFPNSARGQREHGFGLLVPARFRL